MSNFSFKYKKKYNAPNGEDGTIQGLFEMMDAAIIADNASKVESSASFELIGFTESLVRR